MGKLGVLAVSGLLGISAMACASAPARSAADVPPPTPREDHAITAGRTPALSAAISAPDAEGRDKAKAAPAVEEVEPQPVPDACGAEDTVKGAPLCAPPREYAAKLCGGIYPEVALGLFAKTTPFTRVYMAGDVEAWNASGGLTHRAKLAFDEEVVVLAKHAAGGSGGIVMTGAQASYDVLRWDGTCVSVMEGEITTKRPPAPKPAEVPWTRLEETTRRALLAAPKVKSAHEAWTKTCTTASTAAEKKKCAAADKAFARAIVDYVRAGGELPTPARRP